MNHVNAGLIEPEGPSGLRPAVAHDLPAQLTGRLSEYTWYNI